MTRRIAWWALALATVAGLLFGWQLFWFQTDDAYIAYRYISNAQLGYGYVWNPPPFQPVEGYTSLSWVLLLDVVWRLTGIDPPAAANGLSLVCSALTLALVARLTWRILAPAHAAPLRLVVVALVLLGTLTNRTFLAWTSSGLETALFNALLTAWIAVLLEADLARPGRCAQLSLLTAVLTATRPDGLLCTVLTATLWIARWWRDPQRARRSAAHLLGAAPLGLVVVHLLWRFATYGEWLPNTHRAKQLAPWPAAGARYFASFVIEYSLWCWILPALWFAWRLARQGRTTSVLTGPRLVVAAALGGQFCYYTLIIGGDHFEYRVYSHLVPLIFLSFVALGAALGCSLRRQAGALALFVALSWPIPWVHWGLSQSRLTRPQTFRMKVAVAPAFPWPLRSYVGWFDALQFWLIDRSNCRRHQEHKQFTLFFLRRFPTRAAGLALPREQFPVIALSSVGIPAWTLPHIAVIDKNGLNDRVIARTPIPAGAERMLAHDRAPPPGYVACFAPNVTVEAGQVTISPRAAPLTAAAIAACERRDWTVSAAEVPVPHPFQED